MEIHQDLFKEMLHHSDYKNSRDKILKKSYKIKKFPHTYTIEDDYFCLLNQF